MKRQIVNIINFIRGCEPREKVDLYEPVREQIRLMKKYDFKGTFLVQYDALIDPVFAEMLKELNPERFEIGVWHEIVQPMVEKLGMRWTGRFPWDWHVHCGFSQGYTKAQRVMLADELFEKFKETFGYYPKVFGSWIFDTHTVRYLSDKYGLDAIINCKEQYGTDGYTLWGGYYGQGYYPSKNNVFMPAQSEGEQINVPLFRMLGSDPVYQYDFGLDIGTNRSVNQGVVTLEPVYCGDTGGGGVPKWVDWYLKENYNGDCLSFGYAQAGQENSFGWKRIGPGLTYQFEVFEKMQNEGKIEIEKLGDTGRWFKKEYAVTPASAITAHTAFNDEDRQSVWYSSKYYRINIYNDHGELRIRDLHVFSEKLPDPYEDKVCVANDAMYETLPVVDGNRHSGNGILAGAYFSGLFGDGIKADELIFNDKGNGVAELSFGQISIVLEEKKITFKCKKEFKIESRIGRKNEHFPQIIARENNTLGLEYSGVKYGIWLITGAFENDRCVVSQDGKIEAEICIY